jgi:hypothetical protein
MRFEGFWVLATAWYYGTLADFSKIPFALSPVHGQGVQSAVLTGFMG